MATATSLAKISAARKALQEAESFSDIVKIAKTVGGLQKLLKHANESLEAQNSAARLKFEALRIAGQMLIDSAESGERRKSSRSKELHAVTLNDLDIDKTKSHRWQKLAKLDESEFRAMCDKIEDDGEEITQAALLKKTHVSHNAGENEWYTPPVFIAAARKVMGGIDFDPATSHIAQKTVNADRFFTAAENGLDRPWAGKVWMNPPYAQPLIGQFASRLVEHVQAGKVTQAIVLVNNATETKWFQAMANEASAICFVAGRVRFLDAEGNPGAPLQGQACIYIGSRAEPFCDEFASMGFVANIRR